MTSTSNLEEDPGWLAVGDYHLSSTSALIDAGTDPSAIYSDPITDFDGDTRPLGGVWDIGPDEYVP